MGLPTVAQVDASTNLLGPTEAGAVSIGINLNWGAGTLFPDGRRVELLTRWDDLTPQLQRELLALLLTTLHAATGVTS